MKWYYEDKVVDGSKWLSYELVFPTLIVRKVGEGLYKLIVCDGNGDQEFSFSDGGSVGTIDWVIWWLKYLGCYPKEEEGQFEKKMKAYNEKKKEPRVLCKFLDGDGI